MGIVELWLGPAGCGKTREALNVLRDELHHNWQGVRYLVPTVGHKRSIEHLLLAQQGRQGLFGDPVTTFFNFAEEVAQRAGVPITRLSELQKHLVLKDLVRTASVTYFAAARRYGGFVEALGDAIDELKVHMVRPDKLQAAATLAAERGAGAFAQKIGELGTLYQRYQTWMYAGDRYDNEGIMWIAAEKLKESADLYADLRCLILDGFARLTPIQVDFLSALAPRVGRIIVLFDYEEARTAAYNPVEISLERLHRLEEEGGLQFLQRWFAPAAPPATALRLVRQELFRDRGRTCPGDDSLGLFIGATPAHEVELIAREVRALLRAGALPDGTPITAADIAILARHADGLRERFARTFQRYGLTIRRDPPLLAQTPVGRAMLAVFSLVRDGWQREQVLALLKSGFLAIDPALAFQVDLHARRHYLRDGRTTWGERWTDGETREALWHALAPVRAFDEVYRSRQADAAALMQAAGELARSFRAQGQPTAAPLPDVDAEGARRYAAQEAAFARLDVVLGDLQKLGDLLGGFRHDEVLDLISTALLREKVAEPMKESEGISVLSAHATGGEKFAVVFLCQLLQGAFPRFQRESAFLMDHERDEVLPELQISIDQRKNLEEDEQYWFLHALSAATRRLVLCYPQHGADGDALERSSFLDEVEKIVPDLRTRARTTSFRDVVPPLEAAESAGEFLAGLAYGIRAERDPDTQRRLAAAYAGSAQAGERLAALFARADGAAPVLGCPHARRQLAERVAPLSASELQSYLDCPFLWFGASCLGVEPVVEEFSPLDRGTILHAVLEKVYRERQARRGEPVHLEQYTIDEIWPAAEADLFARLEAEPRFRNRAQFLRDIEWERLSRMIRRFLANEIERARTRRVHPAYFEERFGAHGRALALGDGSITLRGTIDRIDLADDDPSSAVVVDYKSSAGMTLRDLAAGKVLQAPIYLLALERLFRYAPLGAEFMGLKEGSGKGVFREEVKALYGLTGRPRGMSLLPDDAWQQLLAQSEQQICGAADGMRAGLIAAQPTTDRCPKSCDYLALCRGNPFALSRLVRRGRQAPGDAGGDED